MNVKTRGPMSLCGMTDKSESLPHYNDFRHSLSSLEMKPSQERIKSKESPRDRVKKSSRNQSADYTEVSEIKNLFHQLQTSSNATEEHGKIGKSGKVCASAFGGPRMSPNATMKEEKGDHKIKPTRISSSAPRCKEKNSCKMRGGEKEMKHKTTSKMHKERKDRNLLPDSPPQDVFASGYVIVDSSGESRKTCVSATGSPYLPTSGTKEEKEAYVMEPTTPSSSYYQRKEKNSRKERAEGKEMRRKKISKEHKKQKDHTLPPVSPPQELDVPGNITVASSMGGPSQFPQSSHRVGHCIEVPDHRQPPTSLQLYESKPKSTLGVHVSQLTAVSSSSEHGSVVPRNEIIASPSRLDRDGLIPPPWETYDRSRDFTPLEIEIFVPDNVPLESIFQSPRKIEKSDRSKLSDRGESRH